eukprot:226709-Chlamydomonas_euryale.AAC.4
MGVSVVATPSGPAPPMPLTPNCMCSQWAGSGLAHLQSPRWEPRLEAAARLHAGVGVGHVCRSGRNGARALPGGPLVREREAARAA